MTPKQQKLILERLEHEIKEKLIAEFIEKKSKYQQLAIANVTKTFALVLHDKWDFTVEQINLLLGQTTEQFLLIQDDFVKLEDIEEWAKKFGLTNF